MNRDNTLGNGMFTKPMQVMGTGRMGMGVGMDFATVNFKKSQNHPKMVQYLSAL